MALTFFWRPEGTTLDATHDFSAGDTTATAVGSPEISTAQVRAGTSSLFFNATGDNYEFSPASIIVSSVGTLQFWFRPEVWVDSTIIFSARGSDGSEIRIACSGTDELLFRLEEGGTGSVDLTSNANLTVNNWYLVVAQWHMANDDRRLAIYDTNRTLINAQEDLTTAFGMGAVETIFDFGDHGGGAGDSYLDNLFIGDSYNDATAFYDNALITSFTQYGKTPIPSARSGLKRRPDLADTGDGDFATELDMRGWF